MHRKMQQLLTLLLCIAALTARAARIHTPAFQDELRKPAEREAPSVRKLAGADFQDSVWQAGRRQGADESRNVMYREPFTIASDDEIHGVIDAAHDRVIALAKEADKNHDGVLRAHNIQE